MGVLQAIERERITTSVLVPTMIQMLVDHPEAAGADLSSLQTLVYGASPISEVLLDRAMALLPQTTLLQVYGMTEMAPIITTLPGMLHRGEGRARGKVRSAGQPTLGVELRIVGADGRDLPTGEVGEIVAHSPAVMQGYWNKPEETAAALARPVHPAAQNLPVATVASWPSGADRFSPANGRCTSGCRLSGSDRGVVRLR